MEVVQAIQTSIDIVRKLRELSKKVEDAEFKMLLADLQNELADAKLEAAELKSQLAGLREQNETLRQQADQRDRATPFVSDGAYCFEGDAGAFCTACWDVKEQRVRLRETTGPFRAFGKWECPSCKSTYGSN